MDGEFFFTQIQIRQSVTTTTISRKISTCRSFLARFLLVDSRTIGVVALGSRRRRRHPSRASGYAVSKTRITLSEAKDSHATITGSLPWTVFACNAPPNSSTRNVTASTEGSAAPHSACNGKDPVLSRLRTVLEPPAPTRNRISSIEAFDRHATCSGKAPVRSDVQSAAAFACTRRRRISTGALNRQAT